MQITSRHCRRGKEIRDAKHAEMLVMKPDAVTVIEERASLMHRLINLTGSTAQQRNRTMSLPVACPETEARLRDEHWHWHTVGVNLNEGRHGVVTRKKTNLKTLAPWPIKQSTRRRKRWIGGRGGSNKAADAASALAT